MRLAIVGVTGVVGETILRVLDERAIPIDELAAFASRDRSEPLEFRGKKIPIRAATSEALTSGKFDVVFFASSDDASGELAQPVLDSGAKVIDNSASFRMAPGVPLVIPEVNPHAVEAHHNLFPVANCTAIVLVMGIAPIHRSVGLQSVHAATYQAVSGAGRAGLDALAAEERAALGPSPFVGAQGGSGQARNGPSTSSGQAESPFVAPIFRNVVPQIGSFDKFGDTGEEKKVAAETRKMLDAPGLHVAATTVRVPVRAAHSIAAFIETARDTSVDELARAYAGAPGVVFHAHGIVTPLEVEGQDVIHVARLRAEEGSKRHFQLWAVGDQLRKGAATNGVQILELLIERGYVGRGASSRA
jgi:aspartate-semialdehyde dehydrogenase